MVFSTNTVTQNAPKELLPMGSPTSGGQKKRAYCKAKRQVQVLQIGPRRKHRGEAPIDVGLPGAFGRAFVGACLSEKPCGGLLPYNGERTGGMGCVSHGG